MIHSEIVFGAAAPVPTGGFADVADSSVSVRVEEEEMYLTLGFQGALVNAGAASATLGFAVDGTAVTALPLAQVAILAGVPSYVKFGYTVKLSKGEHKVTLQADSTAATTIDGGVIHSVFTLDRDTDDATLAHGVDSKVQAIF